MENIELLKSIDGHLGSIAISLWMISVCLGGILGLLLAKK